MYIRFRTKRKRLALISPIYSIFFFILYGSVFFWYSQNYQTKGGILSSEWLDFCGFFWVMPIAAIFHSPQQQFMAIEQTSHFECRSVWQANNEPYISPIIPHLMKISPTSGQLHNFHWICPWGGRKQINLNICHSADKEHTKASSWGQKSLSKL